MSICSLKNELIVSFIVIFLAHIRSLLQRLDGPVATAVAKSSLAEFRSVQLVRYEWVVYGDCIINDTTDQS